MTAKQFAKLALSLPDTIASEHMGHPDFRVNGKIFATLGWPNDGYGMVKLTPLQQSEYELAHPEVFQRIDNGWGRMGATSVCLKHAKANILLPAMKDAWQNQWNKKSKPIKHVSNE